MLPTALNADLQSPGRRCSSRRRWSIHHDGDLGLVLQCGPPPNRFKPVDPVGDCWIRFGIGLV